MSVPFKRQTPFIAVIQDAGDSITTLGVQTKCHIPAGSNDAEMIVVVHDVNNLINADFDASNDAVEIYFDADNNNVVDVNAVDRAGGKCGIDTADNNLTYFNVSNRLVG